ncbi:UNVERIFIED_CONTAM: hypothetical protein GTU68_013434 [Idotea baltica]|nr:hypothetical protein [Idotea baltica]
MIPQEIVANIHETAQVEEIVGDYVNLKRRGANLLGLCPFHNEKTPSFTVSPAKNIYKCFGCGKAGNPVGFVMEHEQMSYPEALKFIAKRYNIEVPENENENEEFKEAKQLTDSLYLINTFAEGVYIKNLHEVAEGKNIGLSYFKERGFLDTTIEKFKLGYALRDGQHLLKQIETSGYNIDFAIKLGLVGQRDNRRYDFFRERVMFPIHSLSGKVIAFAGRILGEDKKQPKYVNSPESEIYIKNKILYGIYHAKQAIRAKDNCYMVEGYTDVISLHQAGIENVVASSGTSLTEGQINLVKRFTKNITVLYDGDAAGIKAAMRGTDMLLAADMNIKVAVFPDGEDPDLFIKKNGKAGFDAFIETDATDFILFKIKVLLEDVNNDPIKKTGAIRSIVESLAAIPDPIKRSLYIKQCSELLDVTERIIVNEVNKQQLQKINQFHKNKEREQRQAERKQQQENLKRQQQQGQQNEEDVYLPPSPYDDEGVEPYYPDFGEEEAEPFIPIETKQEDAYLNLLEKHLIRAMLLYGSQEIESEVYVIPYIIGCMSESGVEFSSSLYKTILNEYKQGLEDGDLLELSYFLNHTDNAIAKECTNISTDVAEPSENWFTMHQVIVTPDGKNYKKEVKELIDRLNFQKLSLLLEQNQQKLKTAKEEDIMSILKVQQELKQHHSAIAKRLKIVVI